MSSSSSSMCRLACTVQKYAWGKASSGSLVASLALGPTSTHSSSDKFAELWMGTHPSGPSKVVPLVNNSSSSSSSDCGSDGAPNLKDWLAAAPGFIGRVPEGYTTSDLPFLFKILSIETALSIQAHPDKALAQRLFAERPDIYKDPNHKPEMAIALTTPFEALCGFLDVEIIKSNLASCPELAAIVGSSAADAFKASSSDPASLKSLFCAFMEADKELCNAEIARLIARLNAINVSDRNRIDSLIIRLNIQYPNDRGVLCPLLLNFLELSEGQSFFIGANEPHAYISGDCVECMALSDNVVRAGLTPKYCDVSTLCSMLHYRTGAPSFLEPRALDGSTVLYQPPADVCSEFEVEKTTVSPSSTYTISSLPCASIVIFTKGPTKDEIRLDTSSDATIQDANTMVHHLSYGDVMCLSAGQTFNIDNKSGKPIEFFRAHVNLGN